MPENENGPGDRARDGRRDQSARGGSASSDSTAFTPVPASAEVIEHTVKAHRCVTGRFAVLKFFDCPCGDCRVWACAECDDLLMVDAPRPKYWCEHAADLLGGARHG